jgi:methionine-rich copper-binding protein CopC
MKTIKRLVTLFSFTLLCTLGFAFAHSTLEGSFPTDGSVLDQAPKQVVLNFAEEAQIEFSVFKVYPLPLSEEDTATMETQPVTPYDPDGGADEAAAKASNDSSSSEESAGSGETSKGAGESTESGESNNSAGSGDNTAADTSSSDASSTDEIMDTAAEEFIPTVLDVTDDEAARADTGVVEKDTSKTITLKLKDGLAPGAYVVMWRVLSVDTHTVEGSLTFFVK